MNETLRLTGFKSVDDLIKHHRSLAVNVNFKPTFLYVKKHTKTGLLYFGKTIKEDPLGYRGSGTFWNRHLAKHGYYVETIWIALFDDRDSLIDYAIRFAIENDLLALDLDGKPRWANLILETGIGNGSHSAATRIKISKANSGKQVPAQVGAKISESRLANFNETQRLNYSNSKTGRKNPGWKAAVQTPDGVFETAVLASKFYGCTDSTIYSYCKSSNEKFSNWSLLPNYQGDLITEVPESMIGSGRSTVDKLALSRNGWCGYVKTPLGVFNNSADAAKVHGCDQTTVRARCRSTNIKFSEWQFVEGSK